jgi:hypothetical protein
MYIGFTFDNKKRSCNICDKPMEDTFLSEVDFINDILCRTCNLNSA